MELKVIVEAKGEIWSGGACVDVAEPLQYVFDPIHTDDAFPSDIQRDAIVGYKLMMRKDAARYMAEAITHLLIQEMSKK